MKYERLHQAQEDRLLLLLFQDCFTWENIMGSDCGPGRLYKVVRATGSKAREMKAATLAIKI
jgi:hypothetical protein